MESKYLYRQLGLPVFQNKIYPTAESAKRAVTGDVALVQCPQSGLVGNALFQPALLDYDADYQNEQACSEAFRSHLERVLQILQAHVSPGEVGIEIGCGKGYFLEMLASSGANVTGYDPAYEGSNPRVRKQYFGSDELTLIPDYLVLRHVLEHIPSPWRFISELLSVCKAGTKIYIEVPCFEWIVENNAFYDVFYEHVNYFTLDVLRHVFRNIIDCGKIFGGQYLYVIAQLDSFRVPKGYTGKMFTPLTMDKYLTNLLARRTSDSGELYVWGAGAKGITFSNIVARHGIKVTSLVDINPAKHNKYAGLSGIPILAPRDVLPNLDGADVFVMNPVYLNEIKAIAGPKKPINWISVTA
jgi:SAM-dependent methyltransferase